MAGAIIEANGRPVRLRTRSIDRLELRGTRVEGDSVIGRPTRYERERLNVDARIAVALADVLAVEEQRVSNRHTLLAVAGAVLGAFAVLALLVSGSDGIRIGA